MKAEAELALQLTGAGPRDYRPRAAEALKAFFDLVDIPGVCPQTSQVPGPSSRVCSGGALPMLEKD